MLHNVIIAWPVEENVMFTEARVVMVTFIIAQYIFFWLQYSFKFRKAIASAV